MWQNDSKMPSCRIFCIELPKNDNFSRPIPFGWKSDSYEKHPLKMRYLHIVISCNIYAYKKWTAGGVIKRAQNRAQGAEGLHREWGRGDVNVAGPGWGGGDGGVDDVNGRPEAEGL